MRTLVAAATIVCFVSPALAGQCLNMKDADKTHFTSSHSMTVTTKDRRLYTIKFHNACSAQQYPLTHFVYDQWTLQCVQKGSAFPTNDKGTCFVESVRQAAP